MKARKVKGLDPDGGFADDARKIVRVRVDELYALAPKALDVERPKKLHDLRIAAKRLRYVLEIARPGAGPGRHRRRAHGQGAATAAGRRPRLRRDAAAGPRTRGSGCEPRTWST